MLTGERGSPHSSGEGIVQLAGSTVTARDGMLREASGAALPRCEVERSRPGRSRTRNLMGRNHLLYPVELRGQDPETRWQWGSRRSVPH